MNTKTHPIAVAIAEDHYDAKTKNVIGELNAEIATHTAKLDRLPEMLRKLTDEALSGTMAQPDKAIAELNKLKARKVGLIIEEIALMKRKGDLEPLIVAQNHAENKKLGKRRDTRKQEVAIAVKPLSISDQQKAAMVNTDRHVVKINRRMNELRRSPEILTPNDTERLRQLGIEIKATLAII
jgi:hypothetical protein